MAESALSGLKVVEYGGFMASQCGKLLGDMGAEVIKVEEPQGDRLREYGPFPGDIPNQEASGLFLFLNTSKLGVTLDLRPETGKEILGKLLAEADVFVHDKSPAAARRLGLGYRKLSAINRRLIVTAITPFGATGPYKDYKGYDLNILAAGGGMNSGDPDREPLKHANQQGFIQGGLHAASATLAAVLARELTGRGQIVDISAAAVWFLFQGIMDVPAYFQGRVARRSGFRRANMVYPFQLSQVKDGYMLMIAIRGYQWKRFLEMVGGGQVPDWYASDPRFTDRFEMGRKYADELDERLAPWLMSHTKEKIFALCREGHVPFAPVYTVAEEVDHPHLNQRGFFTEVEGLQMPGRPFLMSGTPWRMQRPAPALGEHNEQVYCERLGYSKAELAALRQAGTI
ncbi:MAG: CoA transferase [Chloroflexi bacterium]|nr:CoA transferase [Chloroflexota bacterium]